MNINVESPTVDAATGLIAARLAKLAARYPVKEKLTFGLDIGIASIGSAVVIDEGEGGQQEILFMGSRCFPVPENPKTKELHNATRREKRLMRRVIRRRRQRMRDVRALLAQNGLLQTADPKALEGGPDPWQARADGLDRVLTDDEFAASLIHIAKHRGFKSNRKSQMGENAVDDDKKMLGAIAENRTLSGQYRTVGQMVAQDEKFARQKRNKDGAYSHTMGREDLAAEVKTLFDAQRRLGNSKATDALERAYTDVAFFQRPLQDSEHLVGHCVFEPAEKRAARHAPSFERFRFLSRLNTLSIKTDDGGTRRLTREELGKAMTGFGTSSKSFTYKTLAKKLGLSDWSLIDGLDEKAAKSNIGSSNGPAQGTKTLFDVVGSGGWNILKERPEWQDEIARIFAFRDDPGSIEEGLRAIDGLPDTILDALLDNMGAFGSFKGAAHLSAKAIRAILPHLQDGLVYSDACVQAGYDHAQTRRVMLDDIKNPVVQRSLRQAIKQAEVLVHALKHRPGRIIIELARDVGKSARERGEITKGLDRRRKERERYKKEMMDLLNLSQEPSPEDLTRFELWKEQDKRCLYSGNPIHCEQLLTHAVEIDHALPRSRSQDNSYANRVLCLAASNRNKGNRTPWEWRGRHDQGWWEHYTGRVGAMKVKPFKKRLLTSKGFDEHEQGFVSRNLNDTRYAARALMTMLRDLYPAGEGQEKEPDPASPTYLMPTTKRRLFSRPGTITAILRRSWGLGNIKTRDDDRHHALDALICAAGRQEWVLNALTRGYQELEDHEKETWAPRIPTPWRGFRDDVTAWYEKVFVVRTPSRRARGQGHLETIYKAEDIDGQNITYERKKVLDLSEKDLARLKDRDSGNKILAQALADWFARGKPQDQPPLSAKGDPIKKVSLERIGKGASGFPLNGGHVDNGDMVRTDVFAKPGKSGKDQFYLIPVYIHQIMSPSKFPEPPMKYVGIRKPEVEWEEIDDSFRFCFSLYADSYVKIVKKDGEAQEGYFRGMDRAIASISLSVHNKREPQIRSIGVKSLLSFRKFDIDRLGQKHLAGWEARTWPGADST